jgi:hypothetical protein
MTVVHLTNFSSTGCATGPRKRPTSRWLLPFAEPPLSRPPALALAATLADNQAQRADRRWQIARRCA